MVKRPSPSETLTRDQLSLTARHLSPHDHQSESSAASSTQESSSTVEFPVNNQTTATPLSQLEPDVTTRKSPSSSTLDPRSSGNFLLSLIAVFYRSPSAIDRKRANSRPRARIHRSHSFSNDRKIALVELCAPTPTSQRHADQSSYNTQLRRFTHLTSHSDFLKPSLGQPRP